jgi:hypothetical protein
MDVGDPRAFLAAVIGIMMEFPIEVMETVVDPVRGLPSRVRRPTLPHIREACEAAYEPIARRLQRERVLRDRQLLLAPPPPGPKMTIAEMEAKLGHPLGGALRRIETAAVARNDGGHAARAAADLAARKVRREMQQQLDTSIIPQNLSPESQ